jgi:hypothetical protein
VERARRQLVLGPAYVERYPVFILVLRPVLTKRPHQKADNEHLHQAHPRSPALRLAPRDSGTQPSKRYRRIIIR